MRIGLVCVLVTVVGAPAHAEVRDQGDRTELVIQLDDQGFAEPVRSPASAPLALNAGGGSGQVRFTSSTHVLVEFDMALTLADASEVAAGLVDPVRAAAMPQLKPAACMFASDKICARLELLPNSPVTLSGRSIANVVSSPLVRLFARRADGQLLRFGEGWLRLAPPGRYVIKLPYGGRLPAAMIQPPDYPSQLCETATPSGCKAMYVIAADPGITELTIAARAPIAPGTRAASASGSRLSSTTCPNNWPACLVVPMSGNDLELSAEDVMRLVALPLRVAVTGRSDTPPPPPPPPRLPAPPPAQPATTAAPRTAPTAPPARPQQTVTISINGDGQLDPSLRNNRRPVELLSGNQSVTIRNFSSVDLRVRIRLEHAPKTLTGLKARGVTIARCDASAALCVSAVVLRDTTFEIPAAALVVDETETVLLVLELLVGGTQRDIGYLRLVADPHIVPPPPPEPLLAAAASIATPTVVPAADVAPPAAAAPPPAATAAQQADPCAKDAPAKTSMAIGATFQLAHSPDFDAKNLGDEAISATAPFLGGYVNTLFGKAFLEFQHVGCIDGFVRLTFQNSFFGGVDSRLLPQAPQQLARRAVVRLDDPATADEYYVQFKPAPWLSTRIGKMPVPTPENMAGVDAGEGFNLTIQPGRDLTFVPAYLVFREGLTGVADEHERDSDAVFLRSTWNPTTLAGHPRVAVDFRHHWDRGPDVLPTDADLQFVGKFVGTQRRRTIGIEYDQGIAKATMKLSVYQTRLRRVDAAPGAPNGQGRVMRIDLISPTLAVGSVAGRFAYGSSDDPETADRDEGFLGPGQGRFSESNTQDNPETESLFFPRLAAALQVRNGAAAPGLANKKLLAIAWTSPRVAKPDGLLTTLLVRARYRRIWHDAVGVYTGPAGHEWAVRATASGDFTPFASLVFFRPDDRLRPLLQRAVIWQFLVGGTFRVPLL